MSSSEPVVKPQLPYWQINVPPERRTDDCPPFLRNISDKDKSILATWDRDYERTSWEEVKTFIVKNDLGRFRRVPSDLRGYLKFKDTCQERYGSIQKYIQDELLKWQSLEGSGDPAFSNPEDYKILLNDWPYGIDTRIAHLVVWTKFSLEVDPDTGDLSQNTRQVIEKFVCTMFCPIESGGVRSSLIWFKNWVSLKSVDGIEHFHVMLFDAPADLIKNITQSDYPVMEVMKDDGIVLGDTL